MGRTYGEGSGLEAVDTSSGTLPALSGDDALEDLSGDVPELVVVGAEEDEHAVGLGVEGGGDVAQGVLDDLLDAVLGDSQLLVELVIGAAELDEVQDRLG